MRVGEIKKELESYGISTRSFLEKRELVEALQKARDEGLTPKTASSTTSAKSTTSTSTSSSTKDTKKSSSSDDDKVPREERLKSEIEKCSLMRASELKKELRKRGVSTAALFEKSELVQALAEARVDDVQKAGSGDESEGYAEYSSADVELVTDDSGPRKRSQDEPQQQQSPFGGSSPFGGGGMPGGIGGMGGMGGMGGIADLLKNMGGMPGGVGAAGANPFGGAGGGSPFGGGGMGDAMKQAQELMKNPKIMALMQKAQSNPRMMKIMQECMSNPAALSKYENDPEMKELIAELKKIM